MGGVDREDAMELGGLVVVCDIAEDVAVERHEEEGVQSGDCERECVIIEVHCRRPKVTHRLSELEIQKLQRKS